MKGADNLRRPTGISSYPGAELVFRALIAFRTSSAVILNRTKEPCGWLWRVGMPGLTLEGEGAFRDRPMEQKWSLTSFTNLLESAVTFPVLSGWSNLHDLDLSRPVR